MMNVMKYGWVASGAIALAMAFVATSCEDDFGKGGNRDDGTIRFEVVDDDIFVIGDGSRADDATVTVVQSDPIRYFSEIVGQDTIPMSLTESHNSSSRLMGSYATEGKPDSRGTYYNNEEGGKITEFQGVAYTDGGKLFFNEKMTVESGNIVNTGRFWPAEGSLNFYGYKKSKDDDKGEMKNLTIDNSAKSITFSYTMPAAEDDGSGNFHDAENQPDLVFAIVPGQKKTAENKNVPMPFHHALSAITFKVGKMPDGTKVKSIALTGCYTKGDCEVKSVMGTGKDSDVQFTWTGQDGKAKYEQSFNQEVTSDELNPQQLGDKQHTFLLIPQKYDDSGEQKLVITLQIKNYGTDKENEWHTYIMEKPMKDIITAIAADKHYIFTIGIEKDEVGVTVDDEVVDKVKKNVTITNTGIASGYVRAAIVGYWLRSEDIMIPWSVDDGTTGKLTKGGEWETYWVKGTDGYFYYKQKLKRGQQTYPLFVTYELTAGAAPVEGALLEINILAQIVHENYLSGAWTIPTGTP